MTADEVEQLEYRLLLEAIFSRFGYDFREYSEASFLRRLRALIEKMGLASLSLLQHRILHQPEEFAAVLGGLTVSTSEMFRDPSVFSALRTQVCPVLRTYPSLNIWHAGCSTGEEVFSLAILLHEEGLLDRATIYATDINKGTLQQAKRGVFRTEQMRQFTENYQRAGGKRSFSEYYHASGGKAAVDPELIRRVVFSEHNLVTDGSFCESHLILCRNVLIYFQRELQERVLRLLSNSLRSGGYLCLGSKETLQLSTLRATYCAEDAACKIYRKAPSASASRVG